MAEPRYRPSPTARPEPYGSRPRRRRRRPAQRSEPTATPALPGTVPPPPPGFEIAPAVEAPGMSAPAPSAPGAMPPPPPGFELQTQQPEPAGDPTFYEEYVKPAGQAIGSAAEGVRDFFVGKEDPKFGKLPSIDESETAANAGLDISTLQQAKTVGFTDAQYFDIIRKQLGNRFLGVQDDANGAKVITFMSANGQPMQAYLNKPGLDYQDVDRGISSTLPFMMAGGVAGKVAQKAPLAVRALTQAIAGATTSGAQDVGAQGMGSQQGIDPMKAGFSAAGGFVGEYAGAILSRILQKYKLDTRYLDDDGKLSEYGRRYVQNKGFDPDLVDQDLAQEIARLTAAGQDPGEALMQVQSYGRFGIPTTKGQRTHDPAQILTEKEIRTSVHGRAAQERMQAFEKSQRQQLENVVRGPDGALIGGAQTDAPNIAGTINPGRSRYGQDPATLGQGAQQGFEGAVETAKAAEAKFWSNVKDIAPRAGAQDLLPGMVKASIKDRRISKELQPISASMLDELRAFMSGKAPATEFGEFSQNTAVQSIGDMRKILTNYVRTAETKNGDRQIARKIYKGYLDWVGEIAKRKMITGDLADVKAMHRAMEATKEVRSLIAPSDMFGRKTVAGKVFQKIEDATTGEEVLTALLGAAGPKGAFRSGGVDALITYKDLVTKHGGVQGQQAWNDVRLAYWMKLVTGKDGEMMGPRAMKTAIRTAMHNQKSVFNALFSAKEQKLMRSLVQTLKVLDAPDPNPSGSGTAVARLVPKLAGQAVRSQAERNKFVKGKVLLGNIQKALATYIKTFEKATGRLATNKALSQQIKPKAPPTLGGYGSTGAVISGIPRSEEQPPRRSQR